CPRRRRAAPAPRHRRPGPRPRPLHLGRDGPPDRRALPPGDRGHADEGTGLMLTVDYDRLGLGAGDRLLDLGCGGGRHAFEALRRGARVVALDRDQDELFDALTIIAAM